MNAKRNLFVKTPSFPKKNQNLSKIVGYEDEKRGSSQAVLCETSSMSRKYLRSNVAFKELTHT